MADAQIQMQQTAESVPGTTPLVHTWEEYRGYRKKEDPDVTIPWTGAVVNLDTQILCEIATIQHKLPITVFHFIAHIQFKGICYSFSF
jgi:hypothetical protein